MSENIDLGPEDVKEALKVLKEIPGIASGISDIIHRVTERIEDGQLDMHKGLSFLDLKNLNLLNYVTNLAYIIVRKLNGKKLENDPVVKRLAELRVVMEKMKPINEKLKYQINKMLTNETSQNKKDPLQFRANPENFDAEDEDDGPEEEEKGNKVYIPPKISASYYDEANTLEQKKKALEQAQKRALSSKMLHELRKEYNTGPKEIVEMHEPYTVKLSDKLKERERYEEEYMLRLPMTKKEKHEMKQLMTVSNFNTKFEDISALEMRPDNMQLKKKSKGKKRKFKVKGKKKGFKGKH